MMSISVEDLSAALRSNDPVVLLDVRRQQARAASGQGMPGALWHNPADWLDWKDTVAHTPRVVLYCAHGREISQGLAAALRVLGVQAVWLEGGFAAWQAAGQPLQHIERTLPTGQS